MLKKIAKLNKNELTKVAGGTVKEFEELMNAYGKDNIDKGLGLTGPGYYSKNVNIMYAEAIEKKLKKDFNIDAYISVGWAGTGFRSTNNTYSVDGKNISHQDVIAMIKAA